MTTWETINTQLSLLLNDAGRESYPVPLRIAAFNRAQEHFAITHTALFKKLAVTPTVDGLATIAAYPANFLELPSGGVQAGKVFYEPVMFPDPGESVPGSGYTLLADGIYLPGGDTSITLWYYAKYTPVVNDATVIDLPSWAEWAVINLAIAYMLYPLMLDQALLRQFQSRREAGAPEDNPPRKQALFCIQLYREIVDKIKPQDRGVLFTRG